MQAVIAPKKYLAQKRVFSLQIIFVSKFIFTSFSDKFFFLILHIMIDSNDIKQIRVVLAVKKYFAPKSALFRLISKLFLTPNSFCRHIDICFFLILYILIDCNGLAQKWQTEVQI